jgi:hypothetical protein
MAATLVGRAHGAGNHPPRFVVVHRSESGPFAPSEVVQIEYKHRYDLRTSQENSADQPIPAATMPASTASNTATISVSSPLQYKAVAVEPLVEPCEPYVELRCSRICFRLLVRYVSDKVLSAAFGNANTVHLAALVHRIKPARPHRALSSPQGENAQAQWGVLLAYGFGRAQTSADCINASSAREEEIRLIATSCDLILDDAEASPLWRGVYDRRERSSLRISGFTSRRVGAMGNVESGVQTLCYG